MIRLRALVIGAAGVLLVAAEPSAEEAAKKERAKLAGTWKVVAVEANGVAVPDEAIKDFVFIFTDEKLTRKKDGKVESEAGYRIDPSKSPKWLDALGPKDDKAQKVVPGLYALEDDTLKLCFRTDYKKKDGKVGDDLPRPAKLDGGKDSQQVLMTLERQK
jgi:uncharacterized protein (TIGR03067 family)